MKRIIFSLVLLVTSCHMRHRTPDLEGIAVCREAALVEINGLQQLEAAPTPPTVDITAAKEARKRLFLVADSACQADPVWRFSEWTTEYVETISMCRIGYRRTGYEDLLKLKKRLGEFKMATHTQGGQEGLAKIEAKLDAYIRACGPEGIYEPPQPETPGMPS